MYGVENGQLVEGISNRKFTLNEKGVWDLDGNPIEYDSERFKISHFMPIIHIRRMWCLILLPKIRLLSL